MYRLSKVLIQVNVAHGNEREGNEGERNVTLNIIYLGLSFLTQPCQCAKSHYPVLLWVIFFFLLTNAQDSNKI